MAQGPSRANLRLPMRVWDAPTRLFHWAIVIGIGVCWASVRLDAMKVHMIAGECVLALLVFRVIWGFVGSETARFSHFLGNPLEAVRHLLHLHRREPDDQVGHNAAGGWMVLAMILILLVQAGTGLFANDPDSFIAGPFAGRIQESAGMAALSVHVANFTVIKIVVVLHLVAIVTYAVLKRHDLVRPMVTGKKKLPAATRAPRMAHPSLALVILLSVSLVVAGAVGMLGP